MATLDDLMETLDSINSARRTLSSTLSELDSTGASDSLMAEIQESLTKSLNDLTELDLKIWKEIKSLRKSKVLECRFWTPLIRK
jgi:hypothetical protein